MVAALIVVGVILFLVVDGLILWKVLGSGSRAGRHGSVSVPGEATLTVPAGRVKLTYVVRVTGSTADRVEPLLLIGG